MESRFDVPLFNRNSTCIVITCSTGAGKAYLANALCTVALRKFHTFRYIKSSAVIHELERAEINRNYEEVHKQCSSYDVLAFNDFGLVELDIDKYRNLFELINSIKGRKSTIVISQLPVSSWYELFKDNTCADA